MAIRLVVTFQAKPGMASDFAKAFAPNRAATVLEPGCEQNELFISQSDPDKLVLLERWSSAEDLERHRAVLRSRGPMPTAVSVPTLALPTRKFTRFRARRRQPALM